MIAKILLTLAVIAGVWFLVKRSKTKPGIDNKDMVGKKAKQDVVDMIVCQKCGAYREVNAPPCPNCNETGG